MANKNYENKTRNNSYKKFEPVSYNIEVEEKDIVKQMEVLREAIPVIKRIIKSDTYQQYMEKDEDINKEPLLYLNFMNSDMILEFSKNGLPSLYNIDSSKMKSINIAANRCNFKTNEFVTFGYKFKYKQDRKTHDITDIKCSINVIVYKEFEGTDKILKDNGWNSTKLHNSK